MILYFVIIGLLATFSLDIMKFSFYGISVFEIVLILTIGLVIYWLLHFAKSKQKFYRHEIYLMLFILWGMCSVVLSWFGLYQNVVDDVSFNGKFIFRQAYYLFFALIVLFMPFYHTKVDRIMEVLGHYKYVFIYGIVLSRLLLHHSIDGSVTTIFVLCFLNLLGYKGNVGDHFITLIIILMPFGNGGELTQLSIKISYGVLIILKNRQLAQSYFKSIILTLVISSFVIPFLLPFIGEYLDVNSYWRSVYWKDELTTLIESKGIGVGYGSSYSSDPFILKYGNSEGGPLGATSNYSSAERIFVTAPHNSFISVAYRLGVIGIALFLLFIVTFIKHLGQDGSGKNKIAMYYLVLASVIIINFNVGLESPGYMLCFFVGLGIVNGYLHNNSKITSLGHRKR